MADRQLDIFEVLKRIDQCDIKYFSNLSEAEHKSIQPFVIMRWLSGTKDPKQIVRLNSVLNPFVFNLQKDKNLLIKLMMASSTSKKMYKWFGKKSPTTNGKTNLSIVMEYYNCTYNEAIKSIELLSKDDLLLMADHLGYQKEDIKTIK